MFRPRIIPVLTLKGKGLVKTVQFNKKKARYIGDPINAVRIFNDLEADELVFLDITASLEERTIDEDLVKQIGDEAYMPFAVGGGIKSLSDIKKIISAGAEKVIINSAFHNNPNLVKEASDHFGKQSIVVSIDVGTNLLKKEKIKIKCGQKTISADIIEYAQKAEEYGAGEIILQSIEHDGTFNGYSNLVIEKVSKSVGIPVIALGGANNLNDIVMVTKDYGASAAAAGSMFIYHGPRKAVLINYPDKSELSQLFR